MGIPGQSANSLDCKSGRQGFEPRMQQDEELFFFMVNACADSELPVSTSCAQHALRWLCTLKIPRPSFDRRRLTAGGMETTELCDSSRIIRMMTVAAPHGRRR